MNITKSSLNTNTYEHLIKAFEHLHDDVRIWIHVLSSSPTPTQMELVHDSLQNFTKAWSAHKKPTPGNYAIYKGRIVVLLNKATVSGCSIDSSYQAVNNINRQLGGGSEYPLYYVDTDGAIVGVKREEVKNLIQNKTITPQTLIINLQLTRLKELRAHALEQPAQTTWVAKYFSN